MIEHVHIPVQPQSTTSGEDLTILLTNMYIYVRDARVHVHVYTLYKIHVSTFMYMYIHTVYTYQIAVNSAQSDYFHRLLSQQIIQDYSPMAFKLVVNRSRLVQDTLNALVSSDPFNFKKPLQVLVLCMQMHVHVLNNVNAYIVSLYIMHVVWCNTCPVGMNAATILVHVVAQQGSMF